MVEVLCVPSSSSARANGVNFDYVITMVSNPICMFPWTVTNMYGLAVKSQVLVEKHVFKFVVFKLSIGDEPSLKDSNSPPSFSLLKLFSYTQSASRCTASLVGVT